MNRLSTELLTTIFNHLHYSQKLQCKLVCRKWAIVLQSGSDIESVAIPFKWDYSTKSHVSLPLIEKVRDGILHGENCRRLILYDYPDRAFLARLFPNLKLVHFTNDRPYGQARESSPELTPTQIGYLQNWHKCLEIFVDPGYDKMVLNIFGSGIFQRLSTITLDNLSSSNAKMITLADKLKNAPNLKKLVLDAFEMDTIDLEKLHSNVPYLETLVLFYCHIKAHREQSNVIQSAKAMKELSLIDCSFPDRFSLALSRYITCTYSSLERFTFITDSRDFGRMEEEGNAIHYTIQKLMRNLRCLKLDVICLYPNIIMELANNAPFLEVLSVDVGHGEDEESLLAPILESNTLTKTLLSLSLYYTSSSNFKFFNRFSHLKHICLFFVSPRSPAQIFELDTMINCLPESLESLKLEKVRLGLSPTHMNDNNISHIRSLTIKESTIESDLSEYLSRHFPKLKSLVIFGCKTKFHFELPNHRLSFVEFYFLQKAITIVIKNTQREKKRVPIYFKFTTSDNISTFYETEIKTRFRIDKLIDRKIFDKHDPLQYDICKPFTNYHDERELRYLHFRCASVQTLLLNSQLIL